MEATTKGNKKIHWADYGVRSALEQMPNGELRFRLLAADGSSYIRTVAGICGGWQRSHFHERLHEIYMVELGWIAFAEVSDPGCNLSLKRILTKQHIASVPLLRHNIYLSAGAVVHTVKFGAGIDSPDWHPAPDLDDLTRHLSEDDILRSIDRQVDK